MRPRSKYVLIQVFKQQTYRSKQPAAGYISPLPTNDAFCRHETFTFMMSHPAMSLGDRLCASRKGGAGGGGWVHPKGANSMAMPGLSFEQPLVGAG